MKSSTLFAVVIIGLVSTGSSATGAPEPLFEGLGSHQHAITTSSPEAQTYFNQGLNFLFGFNHGAAIRSFQEAARLDPTCAMAHWGIALANGPHINFAMVPPPAAEMAWKELGLAQQNAASASALERELIDALAQRYANPQPADRSPLDRAYADAMRRVWQAHPDDTDVGVFFAEAMMDLRPWDQWTPEGLPQPGTEEVLATLDAVLKLDPNHPFANHLYVHALEASPHPERALAAADRLRVVQPGLAHNIHMASHIDIRCGHWHEAVASNLDAIDADRRYRAIVGPPQGLLVMYVAHNEHMLAYAAMMTGQSDLALQHIRAMVAGMPADFVKEHALVSEGYAAMPFEVLTRFGHWDEVLAASDDYPDYMPFTKAMRHAARGIAFAARGEPAKARDEQTAFLAGVKLVPADDMLHNNPGQDILAVATHMLDGEILVSEGTLDDGVAQLRTAAKLEDALKYDEPPGWILPVRHALGAVLMKAGRYVDAEQVYRDDLARLPDNGWSLYGLSEALRSEKNAAAANQYAARFETIWAKADLQIHSSCLCQPASQASDSAKGTTPETTGPTASM